MENEKNIEFKKIEKYGAYVSVSDMGVSANGIWNEIDKAVREMAKVVAPKVLGVQSLYSTAWMVENGFGSVEFMKSTGGRGDGDMTVEIKVVVPDEYSEKKVPVFFRDVTLCCECKHKKRIFGNNFCMRRFWPVRVFLLDYCSRGEDNRAEKGVSISEKMKDSCCIAVEEKKE